MSKQSARKRREEGKLTSVQNATAGGAETSGFLGRTGREARGRKEVTMTRRCCSRGTEVGCNGKETPRRGAAGRLAPLGWEKGWAGLEGAEGGAVRLCCSWDGWRQGGRPATLFIAASGREGWAGPAGPTSWLGWPKP